MAKKLKPKKPASKSVNETPKPSPPDHLTMELFAPGMSPMHRAGLGGLACTLHAMQREYHDGNPPWRITEHSITLDFGRAELAGAYLQRLFEFAFTLRSDGLIYLPGQFWESGTSAPILADLQAGLTLTFLQHGQVRKLAKDKTSVSYDPEGDGVPGVRVEYKACTIFKHQSGWQKFVDKKGRLATGTIKIDGPISPGTVVRHVAYASSTSAEDPANRMLPLYFALVGCLALPVNRGVAVLVVPDVTNLLDFVYERPAMTPTVAKDCHVANAADAGFRAQIRQRNNPARAAALQSRASQALRGSDVPGCHVMTFTPTPWASQQKSRVAAIHITASSSKLLDRFERAMGHLPPRVATRTIKETTGRGKNKITVERKESFRTDSVVRPLIADNLARSRPWYADFIQLITKTNPATDKPFRDQLIFERKGLHAMINDEQMWDSEGERTVVRAVHEALRSRYRQIADENKTNSTAMRNRWQGEYDRWRLAFAGSKTADQFRTALCDLFSRAGSNKVLQKSWQEVIPLLSGKTWQHARDLALLALCSYEGKDGGDAVTEKPKLANK